MKPQWQQQQEFNGTKSVISKTAPLRFCFLFDTYLCCTLQNNNEMTEFWVLWRKEHMVKFSFSVSV